MGNFGKVSITAVVTTGFLTLVLNAPAHALVIAAPLIAISAFKASVFLASLLTVPVTALIHIAKRWGILKTIAVSLVILCLVFGITFGVLSILKETTSQSKIKENYETNIVDFGGSPYADKMVGQEQPSNYRYAPRPSPGVIADDSFTTLVTYLVLTGALFVILLVPVLIILVVVKKARDESVGLKRILAVGVLVSMVIAIPAAFCLGLFFAATFWRIVVY